MTVHPLRGEAAVEGTDLVLTFDVNALCLAEMTLGKTTDVIVAEVDEMRRAMAAQEPGAVNMSLVRALFWAGLQKRHDCTVEQAGVLMPMPYTPAVAAVLAGLASAFGYAEGGDEADPPTTSGQAGTG